MSALNPNDLFMREAIALSRQGFPAPNPRVGAVVVKEGKIVGKGHHDAAGQEHAEIVALQEAGGQAAGAELYVTLEPCAHSGKTPPCTDAIVAAKIQTVFVASCDPNPIACGGVQKLRDAGIEVVSDICKQEAAQVNYRFLESFRLGRPWITAKAAISFDGRIATKTGNSKWISDDVARKRAHELRAECGCVIVGANTVACDNPRLTVREASVTNQPLRVVLDGSGSLSGKESVFTDGEAKTIWVVGQDAAKIETENAAVWYRNLTESGGFELHSLVGELSTLGQVGVLVEGGGKTIATFLEAGLIDEIELHIAPIILGSGRAWVEGEGVEQIANAWNLNQFECEPLGNGLKLSARMNR